MPTKDSNAPQLKTVAMELQLIAVSPQVWYLVGMDLIGPFKPSAFAWLHHFIALNAKNARKTLSNTVAAASQLLATYN